MMSWSFYLYFADNVSDNINATCVCVLLVNTKHGVLQNVKTSNIVEQVTSFYLNEQSGA